MNQDAPNPHDINQRASIQVDTGTHGPEPVHVDRNEQTEIAHVSNEGNQSEDRPLNQSEPIRIDPHVPTSVDRGTAHGRYDFDQVPPASVSYTWTTEDVADYLDKHGLSRSRSTITEWFKDQKIMARQEQMGSIRRWLANEVDVIQFVDELKQANQLALASQRKRQDREVEIGSDVKGRADPVSVGQLGDGTQDDVASQKSADMHALELSLARLETANTHLEAQLSREREINTDLAERIRVSDRRADEAYLENQAYKKLLADTGATFGRFMELAARTQSAEGGTQTYSAHQESVTDTIEAFDTSVDDQPERA